MESRRKRFANTSTNTVVESDCGSADTTDHKGDASTSCVVKHTQVKHSTEFLYRGVDTPALDGIELAGLVRRPTPRDRI
ncbi:hypothetical protein Plhal304r1_c041g0119271 [Plasmopara halstedii]